MNKYLVFYTFGMHFFNFIYESKHEKIDCFLLDCIKYELYKKYDCELPVVMNIIKL